MAFRWFKKHTPDGAEVPDPTPSEIPLARPLTLAEQISRFSQNRTIQAELASRGIDTFDEANDLGPEEIVDDDRFPGTPYEVRKMVDDELPLQTRMDEVNAGIVQPLPTERVQRSINSVRERQKQKMGSNNPPQPSAGSSAK